MRNEVAQLLDLTWSAETRRARTRWGYELWM